MERDPIVFRVGYDLKGDKTHHSADVTMTAATTLINKRSINEARKAVLDGFKNQRIVRALVLIDCIELCKNSPAPTPKVVV